MLGFHSCLSLLATCRQEPNNHTLSNPRILSLEPLSRESVREFSGTTIKSCHDPSSFTNFLQVLFNSSSVERDSPFNGTGCPSVHCGPPMPLVQSSPQAQSVDLDSIEYVPTFACRSSLHVCMVFLFHSILLVQSPGRPSLPNFLEWEE